MPTKINFVGSILTECTYSYGFFLTYKMISGNRERELATFDENRRAVGMLKAMRDENEGACRGEETTSVTTACPDL